jgi:hypothetical protein
MFMKQKLLVLVITLAMMVALFLGKVNAQVEGGRCEEVAQCITALQDDLKVCLNISDVGIRHNCITSAVLQYRSCLLHECGIPPVNR